MEVARGPGFASASACCLREGAGVNIGAVVFPPHQMPKCFKSVNSHRDGDFRDPHSGTCRRFGRLKAAVLVRVLTSSLSRLKSMLLRLKSPGILWDRGDPHRSPSIFLIAFEAS